VNRNKEREKSSPKERRYRFMNSPKYMSW